MNPQEYYQQEREDRRRIWRESKEAAEAYVPASAEPANPNTAFTSDHCDNVKLVEKFGGLYCPHCQHMHAVLRTEAVRLGSFSKEVWRNIGPLELVSSEEKPEDKTWEKEGDLFRSVHYLNTSPPPGFRDRPCYCKQTQVRMTDKRAMTKKVRGKSRSFTYGQVAAWEAAKQDRSDHKTMLKVYYVPPILSAGSESIVDQPRTTINPGKYRSEMSDEPAELYAEW